MRNLILSTDRSNLDGIFLKKKKPSHTSGSLIIVHVLLKHVHFIPYKEITLGNIHLHLPQLKQSLGAFVQSGPPVLFPPYFNLFAMRAEEKKYVSALRGQESCKKVNPGDSSMRSRGTSQFNNIAVSKQG